MVLLMLRRSAADLR